MDKKLVALIIIAIPFLIVSSFKLYNGYQAHKYNELVKEQSERLDEIIKTLDASNCTEFYDTQFMESCLIGIGIKTRDKGVCAFSSLKECESIVTNNVTLCVEQSLERFNVPRELTEDSCRQLISNWNGEYS